MRGNDDEEQKQPRRSKRTSRVNARKKKQSRNGKIPNEDENVGAQHQ